MMILFKYIFFAIVILSNSFGQSFGKNKVQYDEFQWKKIETTHFDLFFFPEEEELASHTATIVGWLGSRQEAPTNPRAPAQGLPSTA